MVKGKGQHDPLNLKTSASNRKVWARYQNRKAKKKTEDVDAITSKYSSITPEEASTFRKFSQFPLSKATIKGLQDSGFTAPTDIQRQSIFYSVTGNDVVGAAKTGSGKTIALLVPVLECLWTNKWSKESGLGALIISPTRELAYQIFQVLNEIGRHHNFSAGVLIGGTDVAFEKDRVSLVNIIVCTPGRLLQHMDENANFYCDSLQILAIDEADRLLDMGFTKQMNAIIQNLPKNRQSLMFSATQTRNVKDLIRVCTNDPVFVFAHEHAESVTPEKLQQSYFVCEEQEKVNILWSYLISHRKKKSLIFVTCCKQARFLTQALCALRPGLSLMGLWGTMNQTNRMEVFEEFHMKGKGAALIATDVASRGLDFKNVDYVLQLDCPSTVEDYIHRVGRTARMNRKGEAVIALTPSQESSFISRLSEHGVNPEKIEVDSKMMVDIRIKLSSTLSERLEIKEYAQRAIIAYAKAYHSMKLKDVFDVKQVDFEALSLSYGLPVAPRIRFLRKHGIDTKKQVKTEVKEEGESSDEEDEHLRPNQQVAAGFDIDPDDDILKVSKKNIFNINPDEGMDEEVLVPQSKKKTKTVSKEQVGKKLLKRGALIMNKKLVYDDEGNVVEDTHAPKKFDIDEARQRFEEMDKEVKKEHKKKIKEIKKEKLAKETAKRKKSKKAVDEIDLGYSEDEDEEVDLSWLPDPDNPKNYDEESDADDEPKNKKHKENEYSGIRDAEAQAMALLNMSKMPGIKPLKPIPEAQAGNRLTDDFLYWDRMKDLAVFQEPSTITSIAFSPIEPYHLASTSSMRLGIFDTVQGEALMILSRFKSMVYGATFRDDGKLLGVGTHEGYAHLYDIYKTGGTNRKAIRMFKAHPAAVRDVAFTKNSNHFSTVSDDGCVAYWDLASPKTTTPLWQIEKAHSDGIRSVEFANNNDNFMITGSYDHTVKVWDTRTSSENSNAIFTVDHGCPVEKIIISPNDRFLFTAGGLSVKIWDLSCGGRFVHALEQHHKTVTAISLATRGTRIITGGIDRRVNVFSLDSGDYRLLYSKKVSSAVISLDVSPNDERIAIAMGNLLSIQYRSKVNSSRKLISSDAPTSISLTKQLTAGSLNVRKKFGAPVIQRERGGIQRVVELTAPRLYKMRLGRLDMYLKKEAYRSMLDFIFATKNCLAKPETVVAAFEQIRLRQALPRVLANRSGASLVRIISFLKHHMFKNQFFNTLYEVADVLATVYAEETLEVHVIGHFRSLRRAIENELKLQRAIAKACGSLDLLIQASIAENRNKREEQLNSIFGEFSIHPVTFRMDDEEEVLTDVEEENSEDNNQVKSKKNKDLPPIARDSRKIPKGNKRLPKL